METFDLFLQRSIASWDEFYTKREQNEVLQMEDFSTRIIPLIFFSVG
jgi:hypothetical protein